MTVARYAEGTDVPVERSRSEIESTLKRHGASAFFSASDSGRGLAQIGFRLAGRLFRLEVRTPRAENAPKRPAPTAPELRPKTKQYETGWEQTTREQTNAKRQAEHVVALDKHAKEEVDRARRWVAAEERRRWRAQLLLVKAKLEMVATGETTVEREFLADMLMPDGQTVGQAALPSLAEMYRTGGAPSIPLLGAGRADVVEGEVLP